jgi:hypothetical protein
VSLFHVVPRPRASAGASSRSACIHHNKGQLANDVLAWSPSCLAASLPDGGDLRRGTTGNARGTGRATARPVLRVWGCSAWVKYPRREVAWTFAPNGLPVFVVLPLSVVEPGGAWAVNAGEPAGTRSHLGRFFASTACLAQRGTRAGRRRRARRGIEGRAGSQVADGRARTFRDPIPPGPASSLLLRIVVQNGCLNDEFASLSRTLSTVTRSIAG